MDICLNNLSYANRIVNTPPKLLEDGHKLVPSPSESK
jgi:hypothetical protein